MNWRRRTSVLLLTLSAALSPAGELATTLCAQDELQVFSDTQLPQLDEDGQPAPLPPVEELPPAGIDEYPPRIDPDADDLTPPESTYSGDSEQGSSSDPVQNDSLFSDDAALTDEETDDQEVADEGGEEGEIIPQEMIRERYENGRVKIERGVAQDERDNYVNHGPWRMWDEQGNLVAEGTYRNGKRNGQWKRWYQASESELFSLAPFNLFTGPFLSQATFRDGQLNGQWVITDQAELKACEWNFVEGRRDGESVWYYHTGRQMRVIHYRAGEIHGELLEWDVNGEPVTRVHYEGGRRLEKTQQDYPDGQKKVEGVVLQARLIMKEPDDWHEAKLATYVAKGKDEKHGQWRAWYPNGQQRFAGQYQWDKPSGEFIWWHANGQKSLRASYENGLKQGQWTWWHPNGLKSIQGQYREDSPIDRWVWWHDTGKVAQRVDFSQPGMPVVGNGRFLPESVLLRPPSN
jgi:antitoxin component YwqK of YwqJK toxin-antitoxin module